MVKSTSLIYFIPLCFFGFFSEFVSDFRSIILMSCFGLSHFFGLDEVRGKGRREKWDVTFLLVLELGAQDLDSGGLGSNSGPSLD